MNLTLTCPTCGAELEVEDVAPGTVIECPACNHALTVPEPPPARVVVRRAVHAPSAAPATQPIASQLRDSATTIHRIIAGLVRGVVALIAIGLLVYYASKISRSAKETKPSAPAAAAAASPAPAPKQQARPPAPDPIARSAWRTITYTGGDNRKHPALVGDGSLAGGCLVIREPRGACLFEIQAPRDDPMGGLSDWSAPVSVFGGDAIRTEQWFRQGNRVATMKVVDDRGDFHPARGRELLDLLLALPEDKDIMLLYPRAGKGNAFVDVPLRGLRAALDSIP